MVSFTLPWLAGLGLLLGVIPLVLHFVVRRPPARAELPTARFLTADPRTRVAFHRRPRDLLLLALRVLFLVVLGMALAGPVVVPERRGTERWVLLDRGQGMAGDWEWALQALSELSATGGGIRIFAFGGEAQEIPVDALPEGHPALVAPGGAESRYLDAFRELRLRLGREPALDSVEVVLLTRPRREGWSEGFGGVRDLLYPGSVEILEPGGEPGAEPGVGPGGEPGVDPGGGAGAGVEPGEVRGVGAPGEAGGRRPVGSSGGVATVFRDGASGRYVVAALQALGRVVDVLEGVEGVGGVGLPEAGSGAAAPPAPELPGHVVVALGTPTVQVARLLDRARQGDTVVVEGRSDLPPEAWLAWDPTLAPLAPGDPSSTLDTGWGWIPGAERLPGGVVAGVRIPLTGDDGRPMAAAIPLGDGCWVASGFRLEGGELPLDPGYPRVLEALIRGCRPPSAGSGPLDADGRAILSGSPLPSRLAVGDLVGAAGVDLSRWFLAAALALAILEGLVGYRSGAFRREGRS